MIQCIWDPWIVIKLLTIGRYCLVDSRTEWAAAASAVKPSCSAFFFFIPFPVRSSEFRTIVKKNNSDNYLWKQLHGFSDVARKFRERSTYSIAWADVRSKREMKGCLRDQIYLVAKRQISEFWFSCWLSTFLFEVVTFMVAARKIRCDLGSKTWVS